MDFAAILFAVSVWALPVLVAITLHEAAHGWMAAKLGDDTALRMGRVSFNPLRHIDPVGTILLPAMLLIVSGGQIGFGYAKPVPVNFARLDNPRLGMIAVAAAGPGINFLLAVAAALLIHVADYVPEIIEPWLVANLVNAVLINLLIALFNLLPIPPLDGGRILVGVLPRGPAIALARMERWGLLIILGAVFILPMIGSRLGIPLDPFRWLVGGPVDFLAELLFRLTGHG